MLIWRSGYLVSRRRSESVWLLLRLSNCFALIAPTAEYFGDGSRTHVWLHEDMERFRDLTLYVLRHGETEYNIERRITSHNDSHLTQRGREQARTYGRMLLNIADTLDEFDFVASPLHRACVSMEILRAAIALPAGGYRADYRLMEWNTGDHIGLKWDEIPDEHHRQFQTDPWNASRPGGESRADLHARAAGLLRSLTRNSVLVTQGATASAIGANYLGLTPEEALRYSLPGPGVLRLSAGTEAFFEV